MFNIAQLIEITRVTSVFSVFKYLNFLYEFTPRTVRHILMELSETRKLLKQKQRFYKTHVGFNISKEKLDILVANLNDAYNKVNSFPPSSLNDIKFRLDTTKVEIKISFDVEEGTESW
jgi:hypothetical protein